MPSKILCRLFPFAFLHVSQPLPFSVLLHATKRLTPKDYITWAPFKAGFQLGSVKMKHYQESRTRGMKKKRESLCRVAVVAFFLDYSCQSEASLPGLQHSLRFHIFFSWTPSGQGGNRPPVLVSKYLKLLCWLPKPYPCLYKWSFH